MSENHSLSSLPLEPSLPLPAGVSETQITELLASIRLEKSPASEMENYWRQDWKRFLYTYGLVAKLEGECLELGANPYFTTILLQLFTSLKLTLSNYFGPQFDAVASQSVTFIHPFTKNLTNAVMEFYHFNVEQHPFPFNDASFSVVLLCEVVEHLTYDPVKVLLEIKRVLKRNGCLVLTTPNVSRLENVCRILAGANIYDPYSGYGPYGRHNREYNKDELAKLLRFCGFEPEILFSADVHQNAAGNFFAVETIVPLISFRSADLGQYLFSRSINSGPALTGRPAELYRSWYE